MLYVSLISYNLIDDSKLLLNDFKFGFTNLKLLKKFKQHNLNLIVFKTLFTISQPHRHHE